MYFKSQKYFQPLNINNLFFEGANYLTLSKVIFINSWLTSPTHDLNNYQNWSIESVYLNEIGQNNLTWCNVITVSRYIILVENLLPKSGYIKKIK